MFGIALHVADQLTVPIPEIRLRHSSIAAFFMLMPKAPVNEYNFTARAKYQVWLTRKVFAVKTIPVAKLINGTPNNHFRLHANATNSPHIRATTSYRDLIGHRA